MAFMNFGNPYQPYPQSDDYQNAGGLPGLLRDAMQRQAMHGDGTGAAATSTASSYGNPPGLFRRLLQLQANQAVPVDQYTQPTSYEPGMLAAAPADAQLQSSQRPVAKSLGENALPSDASAGATDNAADSSRVPPIAWLDRRYVGPIGSPPIYTDPYDGPGSFPGVVRVPEAPEWWETARRMLQILAPSARIFLGGGGNDDKDCKEENRKAREICTDAYANNWKSDYDVGPYSKPSGGAWTIDDCKRGLISEACGGNPYERPPEKKIRRYPLR